MLEGKTVLIVDDEEDLREIMARDFKLAGCRVLEASDGQEAFGILSSHERIDAVVSDVRMPRGSGVMLLEKVRGLTKQVPVVLLVTGFSDITPSEAEQKGAIALMGKPVDRKRMLALISNALKSPPQPLPRE